MYIRADTSGDCLYIRRIDLRARLGLHAIPATDAQSHEFRRRTGVAEVERLRRLRHSPAVGTFRVKSHPYEFGSEFCKVCAAVAGEPCREPRPRNRGGWRFRYKVHPGRAVQRPTPRGAV